MGWFKDKARKAANFVSFGAIDRGVAKKTIKEADRRQNDIKEELDEVKEKTQNDIENLGKLKEITYEEIDIARQIFKELQLLDAPDKKAALIYYKQKGILTRP